jgi:hypothetical protein
MTNDIIIDAVRVSTANGDLYLCSEQVRRVKARKRAILIACGLGILILALGLWFGRHLPSGENPTVAQTHAMMKFGQTLSAIEADLGGATARFAADGALAVQHKDAVAIFNAVNAYSDSLQAFLARLNQVNLPDSHSSTSRYWSEKAVKNLQQRLGLQYRQNLVLVEAADRGQVDAALFRLTNNRAAQLALDECNEISAVRRSLEANGVAPGSLPNLKCVGSR